LHGCRPKRYCFAPQSQHLSRSKRELFGFGNEQRLLGMLVEHDQPRFERSFGMVHILVLLLGDARLRAISVHHTGQGCTFGNASRHLRCEPERVDQRAHRRIGHGKRDRRDAAIARGKHLRFRVKLHNTWYSSHHRVRHQRRNSCSRGYRDVDAESAERKHIDTDRYDGFQRHRYLELQAERKISGGNL